MRKKITIIILFISTVLTNAQITFEKGYFINNSNEKIECFIKNKDWRDNPKEFEYKLSLDTDTKVETIDHVKEFCIESELKYIRSNVKIDRSSGSYNTLSKSAEPEFSNETLFLKVLVEGKANLYMYQEDIFLRFFYSLENGPILQLIYRFYENTNNYVVRKDEQYKQQLFLNLKCEKITEAKVLSLNYLKSSLLEIFIDYNNCSFSNNKVYSSKQGTNGKLNINIRPRLINSSFTTKNNFNDVESFDFESKPTFGIGIEFEYILPINKNKWSLFVEPTYRSKYSSSVSKQSNNVSGGTIVGNIDYESIEVPFGIRHYMFLNKNSKLFVDVTYIVDYDFGSKIEFIRPNDGSIYNKYEIISEQNFGFGFGYKFLNKFAIQYRYQTSRNLTNILNVNARYNSSSIILGYTIF